MTAEKKKKRFRPLGIGLIGLVKLTSAEKQRRSRAKHLEKRRVEDREFRRADRLKNPEKYKRLDRLKIQRAKAKDPVAFKQKIAERRRKHWLRNGNNIVERSREAARRWKAAHPEYITARQALRRAQKKHQRCGCCTKEQFIDLFLFARQLECEVDHRTPLALGGAHCLKNLQPLSRDMHLEKTRLDRQRIADVKFRNILLKAWR